MSLAALVALLTEACKALAAILARLPRRTPQPLTDAERIASGHRARTIKDL